MPGFVGSHSCRPATASRSASRWAAPARAVPLRRRRQVLPLAGRAGEARPQGDELPSSRARASRRSADEARGPGPSPLTARRAPAGAAVTGHLRRPRARSPTPPNRTSPRHLRRDPSRSRATARRYPTTHALRSSATAQAYAGISPGLATPRRCTDFCVTRVTRGDPRREVVTSTIQRQARAPSTMAFAHTTHDPEHSTGSTSTMSTRDGAA